MRSAILLLAFLAATATHAQDPSTTVQRDTLTLLDSARSRPIQVALYHAQGQPTKGLPVVVFSHGYNDNLPGSYLGYVYLMRAMAAAGQYVMSVQHELPTDPLLIRTGDARVVRRPSWDRGVQNLLFVLRELHRLHPELDYQHLTVMGHSQGGDISMLFAEQHPELLHRVISLDNRRMPLPRTEHPQVCSLRSSDMPPDEGVLPDAQEAERYHMRIVPLPATIHNAMGDNGTPAQQAEIVRYVLEFLRQP